MRKQQLFKLLALVLTFALVAVACGGSDDSDEGASDTSAETETETETEAEPEAEAVGRPQGGSAIVGLEAEIVGMRPWEDTCGSPCYNVFVSLYDKLMETTEDGTYEGWLIHRNDL